MRKQSSKSPYDGIIAELISDKVIPNLVRFRKPESYADLKALNLQQDNEFRAFLPSEERFISALIDSNHQFTDQIITQYFMNGGNAKALFIDFLTSCANTLGIMWLNDKCSFGDVTIAAANIHTLIHENSEQLGSEVLNNIRSHSILLTAMPNAQHILGLSMLKSFFDAASWQVDAQYDTSTNRIINKTSVNEYAVAGISVSISEDIDECKKLVEQIRMNSLNPDIKIIVGGTPFIESPDLFKVVNADAYAVDAIQALRIASSFCGNKINDQIFV